MQKYFVFIGGITMSFKVSRADFSPYVGGNKELAKTLVQFDPVKRLVTVDDSTDEQYAVWSGIHECICCTKEFSSLAPEVEDPLDRCGSIDLMLMSKMKERLRSTYRESRITMFDTLLKYHLSPPLKEQFEHSLKLLRDTRPPGTNPGS